MSNGQTQMEDAEQFIIFQLGEEFYGLPIGSVDEIVRCPDNLTRVPRAPGFVRGLMNLRGKAVPIIDQRQRFSVPGEKDSSRRRIVVVTIDGLQARIPCRYGFGSAHRSDPRTEPCARTRRRC